MLLKKWNVKRYWVLPIRVQTAYRKAFFNLNTRTPEHSNTFIIPMKKLSLEELNRVSVSEYKTQKKRNAIVVLDNIRSMHNVGSAFRTSDAFSLEKICLCGITAKPPHREIYKTALGAEESVDFEYHKKTGDCLAILKEQGYKIVIIEQTDQAVLLHEFIPSKTEKYAFVFGNEVFGVSDEALPYGDLSLEIPQSGTKHSLNVSVCIGVVMWDFVSKHSK